MSENKMLEAYRHLLENAKETLIKADMKSWDLLGKAVYKVEQEGSILEQLTDQQLQQVQEDVQKDIYQLAEYLDDLNQGVDEYIEMDLPVLEKYLAEKALSLADPTDLTILRLRISAAMAEKHKPHS